MKKRVLSAVLSLVLVFVLAGQVFAAGTPTVSLEGVALEMDAESMVEGGTAYVSYWPIVKAMYPEANAVWEDGRAVVTANNLNMTIQPGTSYIQANGRYLYMENGIRIKNGILLVPARVLGKALGASVTWQNSTVNFVPGSGPIAPGSSFYGSDDLYWLSHIIHAESGNQPLVGKIAVGNVVLNRVADPGKDFPDTIREVVLQPGQFTPVENGTINLNPSQESILAAKLCLDGANTAGNSMYFVNYHFTSWASRHRPYVATIGAHAFYA